MCRRCRDSCVAYVATHHMVGARGIAPRPPTFRSRCASPSRRSRASGSGAHDATVPLLRRARHRARGSRGGGPCSRPARRRRPAHHLGLSHSTVKHHLANARSKVGAANTARLVWIRAERLPEPGDTPPDNDSPIDAT
jgi:hypothetical protein